MRMHSLEMILRMGGLKGITMTDPESAQGIWRQKCAAVAMNTTLRCRPFRFFRPFILNVNGKERLSSAWEGKKKKDSKPATESPGKAWNSSVHQFAVRAVLGSFDVYQKHYILLHGVKVQCTESCS